MSGTVSRVRVRYPETDRMGVAHHTHFFVWFEVGRTEYMRERGCPYGELEDRGLFFPVVEAHARFVSPARYDEVLNVETRVESVTGARVRFAYRVLAGERELASGYTVHASVGRDGSPTRLPEELRERIPGEASR